MRTRLDVAIGSEAERVAQALRTRYEPVRALTLIGRLMLKSVFAGRSDEVVFWGLVHAHYRGADLSEPIQAALASLEHDLLEHLSAAE